MAVNVNTISDDEFFYGHKACAGCGGALAVRIALKILGKNAFTVIPAGCMSAVGFVYPQLCFANNAIISPFAGTAALLTGDRDDDILYICYDNEAYMNTGIQKSSLTPFGARTTTTPAGKNIHGNLRPKKNMFEIVAAHGITYAATASIGYLPDFMKKVEKASKIRGTKYIHVIAPCPTGWGIKTENCVDVAKEVVDCGLWYLAEFENGEFTLNRRIKEFSDVGHYIRSQGRFKHLTDDDLNSIIEGRDRKWQFIDKNFR